MNNKTLVDRAKKKSMKTKFDKNKPMSNVEILYGTRKIIIKS